jgi:hypothetical protein
MPAAAILPAANGGTTAGATPRRPAGSAPEKKYKCQFCSRAFSRSEHRSRHERSRKYLSFSMSSYSNPILDTKERPFKCDKCRSTFVRRDLLLRHDRTVHAKDGGPPLQSEGKRRSNKNNAQAAPKQAPPVASAPEPMAMDGLDNTDHMDLATAGMLLRDFHTKALASQEPDPMHDSHHHHHHGVSTPTLLEPAMGYASNPALPLWDTFMSGKTSASDDVNLQFNGPNPPPQLPPIMERTMSGSEPLMPMPTFPSLHSGMGTPSALSPYPSMLGPVSPVDYRRSPGPVQSLTLAKAPQIESEEQCKKIWENIKSQDGDNALLDTFRLPNLAVLNRYLSTYFNLFHHHLPFLHPASFNPVSVSSPLLLAVLSIGALYTFEQESAYMLHVGAKVLVNQFLQNKENFSSRKCPLWTMQSTLLNMMFASWSGDPKGLEWACSIKSLLANVSLTMRFFVPR